MREDAFNFGMMVKAPPQKAIGHTWQDGLAFKCESWSEDAKRLKLFAFKGRAISIGGTVKFEVWIDKDGNKRSKYKIRVRSMQYAFFGKNQEAQESEKQILNTVKEIVKENKDKPHQSLADEVPF